MALLRFIVLQTILAAGLIALWLSGPLAQVFAGDSRWFVAGVLAFAGIGTVFAGLGDPGSRAHKDAERIQDLLPVIAVIAMQAGILGALAIMAQALISAGDPARAVGGFFGTLSTALYVSVSALASYVWIKLTLWLAHGE